MPTTNLTWISRLELRDDTAKEWIIEKVSFAAAYENERVPAFLYLPKNSPPPFQTIIFFPGSNVAFQVQPILEKLFDFQSLLSAG